MQVLQANQVTAKMKVTTKPVRLCGGEQAIPTSLARNKDRSHPPGAQRWHCQTECGLERFPTGGKEKRAGVGSVNNRRSENAGVV
jgi:hypothetical protein